MDRDPKTIDGEFTRSKTPDQAFNPDRPFRGVPGEPFLHRNWLSNLLIALPPVLTIFLISIFK